MKRIIAITSLIAAASFANAAETEPSADFFLSAGPSVGYFGSDFDTAVGANLTFGLKLRNEHSLELEVSYFDSDLDYWSSVDAKFIPIVGKYRVPFAINEKLTVSVAGVAGGLYEKLDGSWTDRKDGAFLAGAEAAVDYAVAKDVKLGAGVTALYASETDITTDGVITLVHLRATFSF